MKFYLELHPGQNNYAAVTQSKFNFLICANFIPSKTGAE